METFENIMMIFALIMVVGCISAMLYVGVIVSALDYRGNKKVKISAWQDVFRFPLYNIYGDVYIPTSKSKYKILELFMHDDIEITDEIVDIINGDQENIRFLSEWSTDGEKLIYGGIPIGRFIGDLPDAGFRLNPHEALEMQNAFMHYVVDRLNNN